LHDITELKRAENALRETEERYRLLAENSLVGVYLHQDTFFVYVSPMGKTLLGYSPDELKKMRFWEIFHPDVREMIKEQGLARYRGEMQPSRYEARLVTKGGEIRWIEISAASVQYQGRAATIGTFVDVTGRRRTEEALQQSEQRFRAIFNSAAVGIDVLDRSGRFVQVNTALANMLGYTREELSELTPFKLTHPDDLAKSRENLDALVRGETRTYRLEKRYIRKDGLILVADVMVSAIYNGRGLYESTIGVVSDITQRKQAEEQVKASLKEKEILLQEIHHRVKNNLALVGSLLTLQAGYADETHRRMFDDLEARVRSMALAHEKLYQSESLADLKIGEYVSGLVDHLVAATSMGAPIRLVKEIDDVSFGIDTAIPLGFLLTELVSNSLKHAFSDGREGEIRICLQSVGDNEFELAVSDNGVGMPEDIDLSNPASLGMDLVDAFVHKLKGSSKIVRDNGTQVRIIFKEV
jgi:PAS domain S-box-containing protein